MSTAMRFIALGCCVTCLIVFLFLPVVSGLWGGSAGIELFSHPIIWITVLSFGAMAVCAMLLPGKIAALVSLIGSLMPLISYFIIAGEAGSVTSAAMSVISYGYRTSYYYTPGIGIGTILAMIFGSGSAALCFFSDFTHRPTRTSPGLGSDSGDEW